MLADHAAIGRAPASFSELGGKGHRRSAQSVDVHQIGILPGCVSSSALPHTARDATALWIIRPAERRVAWRQREPTVDYEPRYSQRDKPLSSLWLNICLALYVAAITALAGVAVWDKYLS